MSYSTRKTTVSFNNQPKIYAYGERIGQGMTPQTNVNNNTQFTGRKKCNCGKF